MRNEIILDIAELIQQYFDWTAENPQEAAKYDGVYAVGGKYVGHDNLIGFSRWIGRNSQKEPS